MLLLPCPPPTDQACRNAVKSARMKLASGDQWYPISFTYQVGCRWCHVGYHKHNTVGGGVGMAGRGLVRDGSTYLASLTYQVSYTWFRA